MPNWVSSYLSKGPNCLVSGKTNYEKIAMELEPILASVDEVTANGLRWRVAFEIERENRKRIASAKDDTVLGEICRWLDSENLVCTRDDKSKKIVFLEKNHYNNLLEDFLRESMSEEINQDPTSRLQKEVIKLNRDPRLPRFLRNTVVQTPACPRLFGFPKLHNTPVAARPIVEKFRSPCYKMEKKLAAWCMKHLKGYEYSLRSSHEFLDALGAVGPLPQEVMSVFDYESLYPTIMIEPACLELYRFMLKHLPSKSNKEIIRSVCHLLCHESYFTF